MRDARGPGGCEGIAQSDRDAGAPPIGEVEADELIALHPPLAVRDAGCGLDQDFKVGPGNPWGLCP
ncbi:hypothetical protein [Arthrobacter livingstonensis]|uniref:hypothetical protein n=1 Tax=Arthrobacter livingstonensis TaxID=670078 RepID=UPI0011B7197C|nr:hypothetical protein [Arthrobacter livingstonensis]